MRFFSYGCTRFVILVGDFAIKIALPLRPFLPFFGLIRALRRGEFRMKLKKYQGRVLREAARRVTTYGISVNRQEIRLSEKYRGNPMIAHVLHSYLWGFIIVMPRGERVSDLSVEWFWCKESIPKSLPETDLFEPDNMARFGDRICIVDYGHPDAEAILSYIFGPGKIKAT